MYNNENDEEISYTSTHHLYYVAESLGSGDDN